MIEYTEEMLKTNMKHNTRIYPIHKMLSWDLLFYYSIIFLFLTQVKGFSASQVLFLETIFTFFAMITQIPAARIVDTIGKKHSIILANVLISIYVASLIFITQLSQLYFTLFLWAIGHALRGISETNILYESLPTTKFRGAMFSKIDGKATFNFYWTDAITGAIAGFLYVINPYLPIICSLICCIFATYYSFKFRHTNIVEKNAKVSITFKEYLHEIGGAFKHIKRSRRMFCLMLFYAIFTGLLYAVVPLRSSLLTEMKLPEQYFGVVIGLVQLLSGSFALYQEKIHLKFKNRTLAILSLPITISCIAIGIIGAAFGENIISLIGVISLFLVHAVFKGPYFGLSARYINNFTNRSIRIKITALRNLLYYLSAIVITFIASIMLQVTSTAILFILIGCVYTLMIMYLLEYMKDKVGLKTEEYSEEELKYASKVHTE